ncbi:MAG TPA: non-canonical purine NTP pyrophosphatase [Planctomycetota bacterium]|nr:non-canonical purine NTP pyrophosphatase [Planctomycetota bacterium]
MNKKLTIILGTKNRHKVREIMAIYRQLNPPKVHIKFIPLYKYPDAPPVKENGKTYLANAVKKALTWARYTGLPTLAEDSGIEIKALNWQPGIYSARYASRGNTRNATHRDNNQKLLAKLQGLPMSKRIARYRCSAVIASPEGRIIARAQGTCSGRIALKSTGKNGFGYDPVFIPKLTNSNFKYPASFTFGQLPARLKHRISHRGIALTKIFRKIF